MRNSRITRIWTRQTIFFVTILSGTLLMTACGPDKQAKSDLTEGYTALESQQYDQAMTSAETYLKQRPGGVGTAEALYLKGRALEQKPASNPNEAQSNLQAARSAYIEALSKKPAPKLETYIKTSLANVAYFQNDYATAAQEWSAVYDKLEDENVKSWVLYRVGICKQRQEQPAYADADQIFANVQQKYPNTVPAQRAREHQGARGFTVQLATFNAAPQADAAITALRTDRVAANRQTDPKGRSIVVAGPMPTYQQALSLKSRYASKYPDAIILP